MIERSVYEIKGGGWGEKDTKNHARRRISLDPTTLQFLEAHHSAVEQADRRPRLTLPLTVSSSPAHLPVPNQLGRRL